MALRATAGGAGGGGGGTITSVNGQTGPAVTITPANINGLGLPINWNASTNTPTLVSSTPPASGNAYLVTVAGTTTLDGISTWSVGDIAYFGANSTWQRIAGVALVTAVQKGDGVGGLTSAVSGVDYGAPILFQNSVEILIPPTGSIANNGALTLGTALAQTLSDGCWMSFPPGAIATSIPTSSSILYWVVMSSTTLGTIFNNTYTPGTNLPLPPVSPTAFATTGPGAYTQVTASIALAKPTVPGNVMGNNGSIALQVWMRSNNSAGAKILNSQFGVAAAGFSINETTQTQTTASVVIYNKGNPKKQKCNPAGIIVSGNSSTQTFSTDTTVAQSLSVLGQIAVATDWLQLDAYSAVVTGSP